MDRIETDIPNPFGAPVYFIPETESTMLDARELAQEGARDGTVIVTDYQRSGRGRIEGRQWVAARGESLLCTILFRGTPISGFTLRVGLAAAEAFDVFLPPSSPVTIKWPNDILIDGRKAAGILCESDGATVYAGTGFNIAQRSFPTELSHRASSLAMELDRQATAFSPERIFQPAGPPASTPGVPSSAEFLPVYLGRLKEALSRDDWHDCVSSRLWRKGEDAVFLAGDPGRREEIRGRIEGIGPSGQLLIRCPSPGGDTVRQFFSGEFPYGGEAHAEVNTR